MSWLRKESVNYFYMRALTWLNHIALHWAKSRRDKNKERETLGLQKVFILWTGAIHIVSFTAQFMCPIPASHKSELQKKQALILEAQL